MRFSPLDSSEDFMGEVVSVFAYPLYFPTYDVISVVIMSDAGCTAGREPRSVAASCTFSEIRRDICRKSPILTYFTCISRPVGGDSIEYSPRSLTPEKLNAWALFT